MKVSNIVKLSLFFLSFFVHPIVHASEASNGAVVSNMEQTSDTNKLSNWSVGIIYRGSPGITFEHQNKNHTSYMFEHLPASTNNAWAKREAGFSPIAATANTSFYFKVQELYDVKGTYFKLGLVQPYGANSVLGLYQDVAIGYEWGSGRIKYVFDWDVGAGGSFAINYRL